MHLYSNTDSTKCTFTWRVIIWMKNFVLCKFINVSQFYIRKNLEFVRNFIFGANMDFRILEWLWILYIFLCFCFEGIKESINDVTGNYLNFPIRGFNIPMQLFVIIRNIVLLLFLVFCQNDIYDIKCAIACF